MQSIELRSPHRMSPPERAAEITAILAAAIIRTYGAHPVQAGSETAPQSPVQLGFCPPKSVHATPYPKESL